MELKKENIILKAENISKQYRLGLVGTGTLSHDLNRWWHRVRGKEDPFLKVGSVNDRSTKADSEYVWALQDINFEVQRGEVLGIIGKNGAGKSTLLKILSRVTSPTTGEIKTRGRIASLLEVGTGFHPELTGRENIYLNGAILGMTKAEIKTKELEIVEFSGCERYIDTPVKRYSSGMRVRLAFAVAAHLEPDILVIDEVLAVGDAEFQKKAIGKMQDISRGEGRTVLFVSHNMDSVRKLCSTGVILTNGKISEKRDIEFIVDEYLSQNNDDDCISLKERRNREGNGKVILTKIEVLNPNTGTSINEIVTGMNVEFKVNFELKDYTLLNSYFEIGLAVTTKNDQFITVFNNKMANYKLMINASEGFAICSVDNFPLTEGEFVIRALIKNDYSIFDIVENAIKIHVHPGDFYNSGKINSYGRQGIYINQKWSN